MITDEDVDKFLEHFGVSGMHWGQRSRTQKAGITGAALLGSRLASTLAVRMGGNPKLMTAAIPIGLTAGALTAGRLLDRQGRTKVSDAKTKTSRNRSSTGAEKVLLITTGALTASAIVKGGIKMMQIRNQL
jgi:hypothetical protein